MSKNEIVDYHNFDNNILEETLRILNSKVSNSLEFCSEQGYDIEISCKNIPLCVKDDLIDYLEGEAEKYLINLVLSNSMKLGDFKCHFDEEENCIIWSFCNLKYKIQGKWRGNEVIISIDGSILPLIACTECGSEWKDITNNFIIQKI